MTGAKLEYHTRAVFTMKALSDASSITFTVSNVQESTTTDIVWPILKAVGAIGSTMGDFLPTSSATSLTLLNTLGSIGFERRFSDLLERYTIINQQVLIYVSVSPIGSFVSADHELRWAGTVRSVRQSRDDLTINIAGRGITDRTVNTMVTAERFSDAPESSLGYALPVIFGQNVQVRPVPIESSTITSQLALAYATNLRTYQCEGLQTAYAKAYDGKYYSIAAQAAGFSNSYILGNSYVAGKSATAWGTVTEIAHRFDAGASGYILTGASLYVYKALGTAAGDMEIRLQADDLLQNGSSANWGRAPGTVLGRGNYQLDQLAAAAGAYELRVNFDKPVVVPPYSIWFLAYKLNNDTTAFIQPYYDNAVTENLFYKTSSDSLWLESTLTKKRYWGMWGLEIYEDNPFGADADNVWAQVFLYQNNTLDEMAPLETIDWVFEVNGLQDDSSGTVTGVASQLIESPQHIVELMTKVDTGSVYSGGQFGSEHSSTWPQVNTTSSLYYRKVAGKTSGATRLSSFLQDLCRATASRITMHPSASTPLGYWAWGYADAVADDITQDECELISGEILGTESIVNLVEMFYAEKLTGLDFVTSSGLGEFKTFSGRFSSTDTTLTSYDQTNSLTTVSRSLFGNMELSNKTNQWIGDATSAKNVGLSYLIRHLYPSVFYTIEAPYFRFKARKLLDIVRITHPDIAAFFGTTPHASKAIYVAGSTEVDISTGFHWARANSSRAQIEGIQTIFDSSNTPRIRLTLRLLNNSADPT